MPLASRCVGCGCPKVELPDVRAIRLSLKMSQHHFAATYLFRSPR